MKRTSVILVTILFATAALGQIGETLDDFKRRYGEGRADNTGEWLLFRSNDYEIVVGFTDDVATSVIYRKRGGYPVARDEPLSDSEIDALMRSNGRARDWRRESKTGPTGWVTTDGELHAVYKDERLIFVSEKALRRSKKATGQQAYELGSTTAPADSIVSIDEWLELLKSAAGDQPNFLRVMDLGLKIADVMKRNQQLLIAREDTLTPTELARRLKVEITLNLLDWYKIEIAKPYSERIAKHYINERTELYQKRRELIKRAEREVTESWTNLRKATRVLDMPAAEIEW